MAVFKCKMCGGTLKVSPTGKTGVCEFCGTEQTLPSISDEKVSSMYNQASSYLKSNEYDKAQGLYQKVQQANPNDAESYWSILLCQYGIEYVEDPATKKRLPTMNRTQYTSIFDDENYKNAIKYATPEQRKIYEAEATRISEIQKGILTISKKEAPFDVFISYKETDAYGRRTRDSVYAHELYSELSRQGFKVFYAPVTLQNILGSAYEPYIFAALNSSKVMVVIGTSKENFEAVWVKNEWSRFLKMIREGKSKLLIPAYRDMDAYDLPDEFSHLQALNMTKLGFMIDLVEGIKKFVYANKREGKTASSIASSIPSGSGHGQSDVLLKRAKTLINNNDWWSAKEKINEALDMDPENGYAHFYMLLATLRISDPEKLTTYPKPINQYGSFKNAIEFGDDQLVDMLNSYSDANQAFIKNKQSNGGNSLFGFLNSKFQTLKERMPDALRPKPVAQSKPPKPEETSTVTLASKTPKAEEAIIKILSNPNANKVKLYKIRTGVGLILLWLATLLLNIWMSSIYFMISSFNGNSGYIIILMIIVRIATFVISLVFGIKSIQLREAYYQGDRKKVNKTAGIVCLILFWDVTVLVVGIRGTKFWKEHNNPDEVREYLENIVAQKRAEQE